MRDLFLFCYVLTLLVLGFHSAEAQRKPGSLDPALDKAARSSALVGEVTELKLPELSARLGSCREGGEEWCVHLTAGSRKQAIWISPKRAHAVEIGLMGHHFPGAFEAVYVYWRNEEAKSAIVVIDPNRLAAVAWVSNKSQPEYNTWNSYFSVVRAPDGKGYPFLAPGMRYLHQSHADFLCRFDVSAISYPDQNCGTGFRSASVAFPGHEKESGFRHNRGWLQDIDGDGYDDIHLPHFKYILTISGRSWQPIALSLLDVAQFSEPYTPKFFHSGRYYGGYTMFTDPQSGQPMTLLSAGSTVGSFANWNCNVSRYMAAIRWGHDAYRGRNHAQLAWSHYISFSTTIFAPSMRSLDDIYRRGNGIDGCVHRFDDSLIETDRNLFAAYSQFHTQDKINCEAQTFKVQKNGYQESDMNEFRACAEAGVKKARGSWSVELRDAVSGAPAKSLPNAYLWGRVRDVLPARGELLLLEAMGELRFDRAGYEPSRFVLGEVGNDAKWVFYTELRKPGAMPKLDYLECYASQSANQSSSPDASCGKPELVTKDVDGDGYNDVQLENGRWFGWSAAKNALILKSL